MTEAFLGGEDSGIPLGDLDKMWADSLYEGIVGHYQLESACTLKESLDASFRIMQANAMALRVLSDMCRFEREISEMRNPPNNPST